MKKLLNTYEKELYSLKERLNTAMFIGDNQKIRIETEIEVLQKVLNDLYAFNEKY